jgi:hypothetical protein
MYCGETANNEFIMEIRKNIDNTVLKQFTSKNQLENVIYYDPKLWSEEYLITRGDKLINLVYLPTDTIISTYKSDVYI